MLMCNELQRYTIATGRNCDLSKCRASCMPTLDNTTSTDPSAVSSTSSPPTAYEQTFQNKQIARRQNRARSKRNAIHQNAIHQNAIHQNAIAINPIHHAKHFGHTSFMLVQPFSSSSLSCVGLNPLETNTIKVWSSLQYP